MQMKTKTEPKYKSLYDMFPKVGDNYPIKTVLEVSGIESLGSVRTYLSLFRNHLPEEEKIDVKIVSAMDTIKRFK